MRGCLDRVCYQVTGKTTQSNFLQICTRSSKGVYTHRPISSNSAMQSHSDTSPSHTPLPPPTLTPPPPHRYSGHVCSDKCPIHPSHSQRSPRGRDRCALRRSSAIPAAQTSSCSAVPAAETGDVRQRYLCTARLEQEDNGSEQSSTPTGKGWGRSSLPAAENWGCRTEATVLSLHQRTEAATASLQCFVTNTRGLTKHGVVEPGESTRNPTAAEGHR